VKPPSTDNSIPVMRLLSFDARNTAAALAPSRCMKRARKGQRQNDSVDLSGEWLADQQFVMNDRHRARSEPLVKTRDRGLGVVAQIFCGSGQRHDPRCFWRISRLLANRKGCDGSDGRWKVLFDLGAPLFLPTLKFPGEFRKSLILKWSWQVDSNHRPPGPEL